MVCGAISEEDGCVVREELDHRLRALVDEEAYEGVEEDVEEKGGAGRPLWDAHGDRDGVLTAYVLG